MANVENINKVIKALSFEQAYFNMRDWTLYTGLHDISPEYPENICGTPSCIGGWCEAIMVYEGVAEEGDGATYTRDIADWLGIEAKDAYDIFYPGCFLFENDSRSAYDATKEDAIRLLERLAETGEVDWGYAMGAKVYYVE